MLEHPTEVWKDIVGYEGIYQVSNFGRVKSLDRIVNSGGNRRTFCKSRLIKISLNEDGYPVVQLSKNGKCTRHRIHRLVGLAFIKNPDNLPEINHKNGVKTDNSILNLEWVSHKNNSRHSMDILRNLNLKHKPRGIRKKGNIWESTIRFHYKNIYIGCFPTREEAYKSYFDKFLELRGYVPWDLKQYPTH